jgi:hypothetical protein
MPRHANTPEENLEEMIPVQCASLAEPRPTPKALFGDKAAWAMRLTLCAANSRSVEPLAQELLKSTHPSGHDARVDYSVRDGGPGAFATITLRWRGELVAAHHITVIEWWFDDAGHSSARIRSDGAPIAVDAVHMANLNDLLMKKALVARAFLEVLDQVTKGGSHR